MKFRLLIFVDYVLENFKKKYIKKPNAHGSNPKPFPKASQKSEPKGWSIKKIQRWDAFFDFPYYNIIPLQVKLF
jgi:hypothetical protein